MNDERFEELLERMDAHNDALVEGPSFAMEQSGVPVLSSVRVSNGGPVSRQGAKLVVRIERRRRQPSTDPVGKLRPNETMAVGALDVHADPARLRAMTEAERGRLVCELRSGRTTLARGIGDIDVLALNEWAAPRTPGDSPCLHSSSKARARQCRTPTAKRESIGSPTMGVGRVELQ